MREGKKNDFWLLKLADFNSMFMTLLLVWGMNAFQPQLQMIRASFILFNVFQKFRDDIEVLLSSLAEVEYSLNRNYVLIFFVLSGI